MLLVYSYKRGPAYHQIEMRSKECHRTVLKFV